jgi:hypothetical protein
VRRAGGASARKLARIVLRVGGCLGQEEREKLFERALGRGYRGGDCPDAQAMAEFYEGRLSQREMNVVKEHVESCARCEEILTELRETDGINVGEELREAERWQPGTRNVAMGASVKEPRDISRGGKKRWAWAAPAGAIAAGLLVWVTVHEMRQNPLTPTENRAKVRTDFQIAEPGAEKKNATPMAAENDTREKKPGGASPQRREETDVNLGATRSNNLQEVAREEAVPAAPMPAPEKKPADLPILGRNGIEKEESRADARSTAPSAGAVPAAPVAPQPSGAKSKTYRDEGDVSGSLGASADAVSDKKSKADAVADAGADMSGVAKPQMQIAEDLRGNTTDALKERGAPAAKIARPDNVIVSPGDLVIWKVGRAGTIERSGDGGITWVRQNSGVTVDLVRGAAASELVCWVVGRGGVILRSVDGGGHWMKVRTPITEDGVRIRADDAMHATVSDGGTGKSFATRDGGVTWRRLERK